MRICFVLLLLIVPVISFPQHQIVLNEVKVEAKALPEIDILGVAYSFKERDYFVKRLLRTSFWRKDFLATINLSSFYSDSTYVYKITGKTMVTINDDTLSKGHAYYPFRKIKKLLPRITTVSITQKETVVIEIKTSHNKI